MTIEEYLEVRKLLENAPPSVKSFLKDICRAAGHEWFKDPNEFANVCTRCEEKVSWMNEDALRRIGQAMASPLRQTLDYSSIKKLIKADSIDVEPGDLPIYDKDIPSEEDKA